MKSWLKGGLLGVVFYIIRIVLFYTFKIILYFTVNKNCPNCGLDSISQDAPGFIFLIAYILGILNIDSNLFYLVSEEIPLAFVILMMIIIWFIIGAFVSWIIGKIKSEK